MKEQILKNEYWYGACVKYGTKMPLNSESTCVLDFTENQTPNQAMPLLISTKGRYLWRNTGFCLHILNGEMELPEDVILKAGYGNLKNAYIAAMNAHFPFHKKTPAKKLFQKIIYNTWIELTFYQNQKAILEYASSILKNNMPSGVLMIDDGWAECYGDWRFHSGKFENPGKMLAELHEMGFDVMVWICPYISADTVAYRDAFSKGILVKTPDGEPFIAKWWNGFSAVLDMSNPEASKWLGNQLNELQQMGVAGFKFDAGDSIYYRRDNVTYGNVTPDEQCRLWAEFGEAYEFNEYRVTVNAGGYSLMQRLCDKEHSWGNGGVSSLIPDMLLQGITGHPYGCPDMIGGGEYMNFQQVGDSNLDQELFIRHSEIACLMPAMQFSAAPFRVLSKENFELILKTIDVRMRYLDRIIRCIESAAATGEPVIRYMSYEFPEEPVEKIVDQFMLGSNLLVAPIYKKGSVGRDIYIPKGEWKIGEEIIESAGEYIFMEWEAGAPAIFERQQCICFKGKYGIY